MTAAFAFLKPFALLAVVAFAAGFIGYLALARPAPAAAQAAVQAATAPATDDWNLPKHI